MNSRRTRKFVWLDSRFVTVQFPPRPDVSGCSGHLHTFISALTSFYSSSPPDHNRSLATFQSSRLCGLILYQSPTSKRRSGLKPAGTSLGQSCLPQATEVSLSSRFVSRLGFSGSFTCGSSSFSHVRTLNLRFFKYFQVTSGARIFSLSQPTSPVEVGYPSFDSFVSAAKSASRAGPSELVIFAIRRSPTPRFLLFLSDNSRLSLTPLVYHQPAALASYSPTDLRPLFPHATFASSIQDVFFFFIRR